MMRKNVLTINCHIMKHNDEFFVNIIRICFQSRLYIFRSFSLDFHWKVNLIIDTWNELFCMDFSINIFVGIWNSLIFDVFKLSLHCFYIFLDMLFLFPNCIQNFTKLSTISTIKCTQFQYAACSIQSFDNYSEKAPDATDWVYRGCWVYRLFQSHHESSSHPPLKSILKWIYLLHELLLSMKRWKV